MAVGLVPYYRTESKVHFGAYDPSGETFAETEAQYRYGNFQRNKELLRRLRKCAAEIKQIQDTELPKLRTELSETIGIFKGKEGKAIEAKIETAEQKVSDLKDRISRMVRDQGHHDDQAFMAAYNKTESIVRQYEWELAE